MNITSGIVKSAQKVVIYGPEGIGKSTLASKFPTPLFIDTEGSTKKLDVRRFDKPTSWQMLCEQIRYVINNPLVCETLVIDTIDWAEQLCIKQICDVHKKNGIEDFGYGNGYVYEKEEFGRFLMQLDEVINKGVNVVLTAHAQLRKFEQPDEMGAYDRWELKLGKKTSSQISPLIKEWADAVFFANYKTFAVASDDKGKKFKAQGGKRIMYTSHHPCWDAKNRDGLPEEIPMEFDAFAHILPNFSVDIVSQPQTVRTVQHEDFIEIIDDDPVPEFIPVKPETDDGIPKAVKDLMNSAGVTEEEVRRVVFERGGHYPVDTPISVYDDDFINGWLIPHWDKVVEYIKNNLR
ncbi:MAG: ATP-binding protein [Clostridia bacterium]|nr:ATP-binding protein [Clostridia bacterium]